MFKGSKNLISLLFFLVWSGQDGGDVTFKLKCDDGPRVGCCVGCQATVNQIWSKHTHTVWWSSFWLLHRNAWIFNVKILQIWNSVFRGFTVSGVCSELGKTVLMYPGLMICKINFTCQASLFHASQVLSSCAVCECYKLIVCAFYVIMC